MAGLVFMFLRRHSVFDGFLCIFGRLRLCHYCFVLILSYSCLLLSFSILFSYLSPVLFFIFQFGILCYFNRLCFGCQVLAFVVGRRLCFHHFLCLVFNDGAFLRWITPFLFGFMFAVLISCRQWFC